MSGSRILSLVIIETTQFLTYIDDILLVIKRADIVYALNEFNSFDDNIKFTINTFENCVPYFLDIEIC